MNLNNIKIEIDASVLTIEDSLLLSALICGMSPEHCFIHRFQLFFVANFIIGKSNGEEDFQRSIENEVDRQSLNKYWVRASRGIYELTTYGYAQAKNLFPNSKPRFSPADDIEKVKYKLSGRYNNENIILERLGKSFVAIIGNNEFANIKNACQILGFDTENRSAPRRLYNMAVRNKFDVVYAWFSS